jgi:MoxR-like ATPase
MVARSQGIRQRSFEQAERIIQDLVESIPVPV